MTSTLNQLIGMENQENHSDSDLVDRLFNADVPRTFAETVNSGTLPVTTSPTTTVKKGRKRKCSAGPRPAKPEPAAWAGPVEVRGQHGKVYIDLDRCGRRASGGAATAALASGVWETAAAASNADQYVPNALSGCAVPLRVDCGPAEARLCVADAAEDAPRSGRARLASDASSSAGCSSQPSPPDSDRSSPPAAGGPKRTRTEDVERDQGLLPEGAVYALKADGIYKGATFGSFYEFMTKFRTWKKKHNQTFRIASSDMMESDESGPLFAYRTVVFHCQHYGKARKRGEGARPNQNYMPNGCRATIRLNYQREKKVLLLTTFKCLHNHPLSAEQYELLEKPNRALNSKENIHLNGSLNALRAKQAREGRANAHKLAEPEPGQDEPAPAEQASQSCEAPMELDAATSHDAEVSEASTTVRSDGIATSVVAEPDLSVDQDPVDVVSLTDDTQSNSNHTECRTPDEDLEAVGIQKPVALSPLRQLLRKDISDETDRNPSTPLGIETVDDANITPMKPGMETNAPDTPTVNNIGAHTLDPDQLHLLQGLLAQHAPQQPVTEFKQVVADPLDQHEHRELLRRLGVSPHTHSAQQIMLAEAIVKELLRKAQLEREQAARALYHPAPPDQGALLAGLLHQLEQENGKVPAAPPLPRHVDLPLLLLQRQLQPVPQGRPPSLQQVRAPVPPPRHREPPLRLGHEHHDPVLSQLARLVQPPTGAAPDPFAADKPPKRSMQAEAADLLALLNAIPSRAPSAGPLALPDLLMSGAQRRV